MDQLCGFETHSNKGNMWHSTDYIYHQIPTAEATLKFSKTNNSLSPPELIVLLDVALPDRMYQQKSGGYADKHFLFASKKQRHSRLCRKNTKVAMSSPAQVLFGPLLLNLRAHFGAGVTTLIMLRFSVC